MAVAPPGIWRKRDYIILALTALAIFLSLDSPGFSFTLEPAWYIDQKYNSMLPPVICDLNGDGKKEVILISNTAGDLTLKVLSADPPRGDKSSIYSPEIIASLSLSPFKVTTGRTPVALKTGYVESYDASKGRNQVIVVVREDWTVACYDSTLLLLWEKSIAHKSHDLIHLIDQFQIDEVAVYLTPINIRDDVNGLVIVGANMKLRVPSSADSIFTEEGMKMNEKGELEHPEMKERAALEHFSVYALDARTGHVVWRHDGLDVRAGQYITGLPQFAYKLSMHDLMTSSHHAPTVTDWTVFREPLIAELPHDWHSSDDTSFRLAHFERQHVGARKFKEKKKGPDDRRKITSVTEKGGARKDTVKSPSGKAGASITGTGTASGRFTGVEKPPLALSASLPHDAAEHTDNPNVIVMHTSKGIEVISLKSGSPITSLALTKGRSYTDLDGDGIVDTIMVLENEQDASKHGGAFTDSQETDLSHCTLMVTSGLPPRARLFSGTVCGRAHSLHDSMNQPGYDARLSPKRRKHEAAKRARSPAFSSGHSIPSTISAASPVILRTVDPKTLLVSKKSNIVVAINTGVITCYAADGELKWQTRGGPQWAADPETSHSGAGSAILFDSDATRVDTLGKHDNAYAQILVVGDAKMVLMSREGEILASTELPRVPIAHPVIGDFDSDGVTDVIIVTDEAVLGYRLEVVQSTRGMLIAVLVLCCLTAIVFFVNIQLISIDPGSISQGGITSSTTSVGNLMKRSVISLARSTDESHID